MYIYLTIESNIPPTRGLIKKFIYIKKILTAFFDMIETIEKIWNSYLGPFVAIIVCLGLLAFCLHLISLGADDNDGPHFS